MCGKTRNRGGGLVRIWHFLHKQKCVEDLEFDGDWIVCRKCHARVGWIYWWNGKYICQPCTEYVKFNQQIQDFTATHINEKADVKSESEQMYEDWITEMKQEIQEINVWSEDNLNDEENQEEQDG